MRACIAVPVALAIASAAPALAAPFPPALDAGHTVHSRSGVQCVAGYHGDPSSMSYRLWKISSTMSGCSPPDIIHKSVKRDDEELFARAIAVELVAGEPGLDRLLAARTSEDDGLYARGIHWDKILLQGPGLHVNTHYTRAAAQAHTAGGEALSFGPIPKYASLDEMHWSSHSHYPRVPARLNGGYAGDPSSISYRIWEHTNTMTNGVQPLKPAVPKHVGREDLEHLRLGIEAANRKRAHRLAPAIGKAMKGIEQIGSSLKREDQELLTRAVEVLSARELDEELYAREGFALDELE
ncbi:hypothetical protein IEO21_08350 [Rhodonia placenta]|uniref:Uncharacterized protein n=1 Tax=Rhodonia placenta TaxID=104341 RepID=A0A8H7NWM3_9APHY|nr:hypothetical protein IEO21_08350 [Postia placenta]